MFCITLVPEDESIEEITFHIVDEVMLILFFIIFRRYLKVYF